VATAQIVIDHGGIAGQPGIGRDDIIVGQLITLRNADDNGVRSWRWLLVSRPRGSSATLSSVVAAQPTFRADVAGSYLIQLTVNEGRKGEVDRQLAAVRNASLHGIDTRFIAAGESDEANWNVDFGDGAGPVPNPSGWWDDLDRWMRVVQAAASSGGSIAIPFGFDTSTSFTDVWVPFGPHLIETAQTNPPRAYHVWTAPFEGTISRIRTNTETDPASPGTTSVQFYQPDGTTTFGVVGTGTPSTIPGTTAPLYQTDYTFATPVAVTAGQRLLLGYNMSTAAGEVVGHIELAT
jgi:hypothetical protein